MALVLVVDDDYLFTAMIGDYLETRGFEVATAENAIDGRRLVRDLNPDLIIMDINMPLEDGVEATSRLRGEGISCPIIVATGIADRITGRAALSAGANALLSKPFKIEQLDTMIDVLLNPLPSKET